MKTSERLPELAWLFLRLGATAFGGPAAHIAMMNEEVVRRRHWLTQEEFLDLLSATNLIPGPNSTEMAIHIGHRRAGWPGLLTAGTCFIVPAFVLVSFIGWAYVRFGQLPAVAGVLYGAKPVIIAIIVQALWNLGRTAMKTWSLGCLGLAAAVAASLGVNEVLVLLAAGVLAVSIAGPFRAQGERARGLGVPGLSHQPWAWLGLGAVGSVVTTTGFSLTRLFLFFLKVGSVLFGSGYVLLAFLRADLVERWHWLTNAQLLDAVTVGQVTPGPVFTTATFIGYVLGGMPGASVATLGIFLPAFIFVAVSGPLIPRLRRSWVASAALDGVNVASLALMAVVAFQLGRAALTDLWTLVIAGVAFGLLTKFRINSAWLVALGCLGGMALHGTG